MKQPSKSPKKGGYVTCQEWMVRKLGLTGKKLMIYSIIQSFSQDGSSMFTGTLKYICFWTGFSKQHALKLLNEMVDEGLIERKDIPFENNKARHYVNYWTTFSRLSSEEQSEFLSDIPERKKSKEEDTKQQ